MREWRSADSPAGHGATALPAGASAAVALVPATSAAARRPGAFGAAAREPVEEPTYPEPPPGVHMPGPSPWPFFAPIGATVMLYGFIFSSVLIVGGLILSIIAVVGWYLDAGREYRSTEAVGHAVPATRDPVRVWPKRLVPIYGGVIVVSFVIALLPIGLNYLNSLTPPKATPTALAVPAQPEITAQNIAFNTKTLVVPAGRPFELKFDNQDAGVPHNVQIDDYAAANTDPLRWGRRPGVTTVIYQVPALRPVRTTSCARSIPT